PPEKSMGQAGSTTGPQYVRRANGETTRVRQQWRRKRDMMAASKDHVPSCDGRPDASRDSGRIGVEHHLRRAKKGRRMTQPIDLDRLRADLAARAESAAQRLLGKPTGRSRGALRFGRKGSVEVIVTGPKAGLWHDFENQVGGDLFGLIKREHR